MNFAWEFILPMALINMFVAGVWRFMAPGIVRWLVCAILIAAPCVVLSALLKRKKKFQLRTYSFAE
jgi:NADH-quinone oxidoreductase subunit H